MGLLLLVAGINLPGDWLGFNEFRLRRCEGSDTRASPACTLAECVENSRNEGGRRLIGELAEPDLVVGFQDDYFFGVEGEDDVYGGLGDAVFVVLGIVPEVIVEGDDGGGLARGKLCTASSRTSVEPWPPSM
jgi:hypothetical protein